MSARGTGTVQQIVTELEARPGQWATIRIEPDYPRANDLRNTLRRRHGLEARTRAIGHGYAVLATKPVTSPPRSTDQPTSTEHPWH